MNNNIKKMVLTSIFAAMSILLYLFPKFSLPFFPSFLEINFSMLPIVICGFSVGAKEGAICTLLRYLAKIFIFGTHTSYVGETTDFLLGASVVIITSLAYHFLKSKEPKKSIISLLCCILAWVVMGSIINVFYAVPMYLKMLDGNVNILLGMMKVIPGINSSNYMIKYVFYAVVPFNLLLSSVVCIVTFFVNKGIYMLYDEKVDEIDELDKEIEMPIESDNSKLEA